MLGTAPIPTAGPPRVAGRWLRLPDLEPDPTVRAHALAECLLDRHGVVTRPAVVAEEVSGGFSAVYRVLAAAEEAGHVRRGYFVESLGASQFATTGAVDRLRAAGRAAPAPEPDPWSSTPAATGPTTPEALVLAATDPANPFGAALPWPARAETSEGTKGHQPGRKAGALVVLVDGALVLYVERGGRTFLSWSEDGDVLSSAAKGLAAAVQRGALGRLTVEKADGDRLLGSDHPLVTALQDAGFHMTPRGLRLRR